MVGEGLGVVAGAGGDDAAAAFVVVEQGEPVERAALLERAGGVEVLELEEHRPGGDAVQAVGAPARGTADDVAEAPAGGADVVEGRHGPPILSEHRRGGGGWRRVATSMSDRPSPASPPRPVAVLQDGAADRWLVFAEPVARCVAYRLDEVRPALAEAARRVEADGLWAVGFVAYEAAPAFDPALAVRPPREGAEAAAAPPLLWLALCPPPARLAAPAPPLAAGAHQCGDWQPSVDAAGYRRAVAEVRRRIARGDTYQVNYTYRLRASFEGDPAGLFADLVAAQGGAHGGWIDAGRHQVCCASPELFFALDRGDLDGGVVTTRPMKGTAPRGRWSAEDAGRAAALAASPKERAENLMIVDMMRNDLGRLARPGSVEVPELFAVERYPTVWQMTSTVTARLAVAANAAATVPDLFAALFPCASITGAPKAATSAVIAELETAPRGVYTGAVGWLAPGGRARFSVAIRTAVVDVERGVAEYGVGGGIVWDSRADGEAAESRLKARVLRAPPATGFELLETLRWEPAAGFVRLAGHLDRLSALGRLLRFPLRSGGGAPAARRGGDAGRRPGGGRREAG